MSRGPYVEKLDGMFSAHNSKTGASDWYLPVIHPGKPDEPASTDTEAYSTRGLKCTDLSKLDNENDRERACATPFWTSAMGPDGALASIQQPSNAPLAAGRAEGSNFAFALGRYVCPFQCGDLRYQQQFSNVPVQIDPTTGKVAIIVDNAWKWYQNPERLRQSEEYRNLLTNYAGSMKTGLWKELEQLKNTRTDFASLNQEERDASDRELYARASIPSLGDGETYIAKVAQSAIKQDVKCVQQGAEVPRIWADNEHIPSRFDGSPTLELDALAEPGECRVTTTSDTNAGVAKVTDIVAPNEVPATLRNQLATIEESNIAELDAFFDATRLPQSTSALEASVDRANIAAIDSGSESIENRQRAVDAANIAVISSLS